MELTTPVGSLPPFTLIKIYAYATDIFPFPVPPIRNVLSFFFRIAGAGPL